MERYVAVARRAVDVVTDSNRLSGYAWRVLE